MDSVQLIKIKEEILSDNTELGNEIRGRMRASGTFFINLMASPGAGKTSLLVQTIRLMKVDVRMGVIEGDIESMVDSQKIQDEGVRAVQIETGGACHLDAAMVQPALATLNLADYDLLVVENIGNLVCPAEFDIGETKKVMLLSIPEGHDKILKYPLMFTVCDVLIINKMDYLDSSDFDLQQLKATMAKLNPKARIFEMSCKTGQGVDAWCAWLKEEIAAWKQQAG